MRMRLRQLQDKDAEYMLEWMHDENVVSNLGKDFRHMTIADCRNFIRNAEADETNRHYAIVDDRDEYMGTISLKNINYDEKHAEYAISCRSRAIGHGFARAATEQLFTIAYEKFGLNLLYLDVYDFNVRAQKMYEKTGFVRTKKPDFLTEEYDDRLLWYQIILPKS